MYTPSNLFGIPLQFDTAVRKGDIEGLRLCISNAFSDTAQILRNDEKYGYLGLCLARFPSDRHGGTYSSMSKARREDRLSMAELLLDFGCSCNPKFVGVDQIERHVVSALLRYPTEYENIEIIEKNREIALCRRLIDGGAQLDFLREFPEHRALLHLLMSHHWLGMLRDIEEFHILGADITAENLATVFDPEVDARLRFSSNKNCFDFPMLGQMVSLHHFPGHPNALTVLALCNDCPLPADAYHTLKWDRDGVLVDLFYQNGWDPSVLHQGKTVLRTWVEHMISQPHYLDAAYSLLQLKTFATHHPECFAEVVDGSNVSDMLIARVNTLNGDGRPQTSSDVLIQRLFEDTQRQYQRDLLEHAVAPYTPQNGGARKI